MKEGRISRSTRQRKKRKEESRAGSSAGGGKEEEKRREEERQETPREEKSVEMRKSKGIHSLEKTEKRQRGLNTLCG